MDPITISVAFAAAKAAVAGVKEAIALGHEIQDCYHQISTFFDSQAQVECAVIQQKADKAAGIAPEKSSTAEALDAVFAAREMRRMEQELKELLIYNSGNESGLYEEMCQRRAEIVHQREEARKEIARQERMRLAAIKRAKEAKIQRIQEVLTVIVGVAISTAIIYCIYWMFNWKDH